MPLAAQFWGGYFGILVDKFGIRWMFNCASAT
jgi:PhnB protein